MYNLQIYKYINAIKCVTKWKKVQVIVQFKKYQKNYDLYKNMHYIIICIEQKKKRSKRSLNQQIN